ncbi:hypothetical protein AB0K14_22100 [Actinosynnema sp. NPDC050801]|uniref:effector-associated domain 2-containing protein n=1 Tax=unclassified Actinosynnema TaxID=2637065 RepID=UPI0033E57B91
MTPRPAVIAIATTPTTALDQARQLVEAVLDGPARTAPEHHAVLLTRPPSDRFPVRLTEAVHRHNDSSGPSLRLRLVLADGEIGEALAVLDSGTFRSAHAESSRPVMIAVTEGYARTHPFTEPDRHRVVRVPGVTEPVWLLDASVPDTEALFHALMAVPSMAREESRRLVLDLLPPSIAAAVPHHPVSAVHVSGLLLTCLEHEGGLTALRHALHVVEGEDSTPMRRIETLLRKESGLD